MKLDQILREETARIVKALYDIEINPGDVLVQETKKEFTGDRTIVVFPLTRHSGQKPAETANAIGEQLREDLEVIEDFQVVKGFLNLTVEPGFWVNYLLELSRKGALEWSKTPRPKRIMVEYSSPNTNKPQHLGHIRNNLLGYAISEILKARGHTVIKANLINDRGIHICKSMLAWQKFGNGETPEQAGVKGDQLAGKYYVLFEKKYQKEVETLVHQGASAEEAQKNAPLLKEAQEMLLRWEQGDPEITGLWEKMNGWVYAGFEQTYDRLGVDFDKIYYESQTYLPGKDLIREGLERELFYKKQDGSVWVDLTREGLDEKLLLRADGTSVYMTQDLGTAQLKYDDYKIDRSVYVVGNEQEYHFKVLKKILEKLNKPYAGGIQHLSYGMVDLPLGKMKSREGTVVDADDLMDQMEETARRYTSESGKILDLTAEEKEEIFNTIGLGALKFYILRTDPRKRMLFKPDESIDFQGHTGPFIQYTHARIRSVMRKAKEMPGADQPEFDPGKIITEPLEKELIRYLYYFDEVLAEAGESYAPSILANYGYNLSKTYNKFYHEHSVLWEGDEQKRKFRLVLSAMVAKGLRQAVAILGIKVPEKM